MTKRFLKEIRELFSLISQALENNETAVAKEIREKVKYLTPRLKSEKSFSFFKKTNFFISIIPTIIACLLALWVFANYFSNQADFKRTQEIVKLQDAAKKSSNDLIFIQDTSIQYLRRGRSYFFDTATILQIEQLKAKIADFNLEIDTLKNNLRRPIE
ncbi:hypothetical protein GXP67_33255 [Rhodocytophaga rosea]|uniref:Uncharacterized protein n=1 Tax=Rhodocytophaga rosea TaxID=2704465 RepID=A0A6C0GT26_9BACT|nr:hypothetical protein [Rhodocytophaga rosea]QHT71176.1 hypothetical protein GXP67_33255 [Rhodocytophaga rosea]